MGALRPLLLALGAFAWGCGDAGTSPGPAEVDVAALFAAPTPGELAAVEAEWASRRPAAEDVRVELATPLSLGGASAGLRVVSHTVDGSRHYGAIVAPDGAADGSLPVLVYAHGGDRGVNVAELLILGQALGHVADDFVYVVPSYRSEALRVGSRTWTSGGAPSPWDRDVDDALALLDVALGTTPAADPARVAVLGLSRGGGVALLMGIRDPRVDRVVEFFGPTDFFGPYVRDIVEALLAGSSPILPGVADLDRDFLRPLAEGRLSVEEVRLELVRRSPALFASRLPAVQIHHGTHDPVVDVGQAERLIAALEAAGRSPHDDEWYLYDGGRHDPLSLPGAFGRTVTFLGAWGR